MGDIDQIMSDSEEGSESSGRRPMTGPSPGGLIHDIIDRDERRADGVTRGESRVVASNPLPEESSDDRNEIQLPSSECGSGLKTSVLNNNPGGVAIPHVSNKGTQGGDASRNTSSSSSSSTPLEDSWWPRRRGRPRQWRRYSRQHRLQRWFGLDHFLLLVPQNYSRRFLVRMKNPPLFVDRHFQNLNLNNTGRQDLASL